jgi:membrane peptidoglycan carboxypeptidase
VYRFKNAVLFQKNHHNYKARFPVPSRGLIVSRKKRFYFFSLLAVILLASLPFLLWPVPDIGSGFNYVVVVHSADGADLAEFYKERRYFVPPRDIPDNVKKAVLAARTRGFIPITVLT